MLRATPVGERSTVMDPSQKALIFDFDGTILDTETPEYEAWLSMFADYGCELPLEAWVAQIGTASTFDPFAELQTQVGRELPRDELQAERRRRNRALVEEQDALPGVRDWLEEAQDLGVSCAIASSSPRQWIEPLVERLGLGSHFVAIATADDVEMVKPDPAIYCLAVRHLGVSPSQTVAIEDSPNGIESSTAAGLYTIAVPNSMTRREDFSRADRILSSLGDLSVGQLLDELSAD